MKIEELEKRMQDILASPDTAQIKWLEILPEIQADYAAASENSEKIACAENRIRDLQDTNQKLFLSVTGKQSVENDDATEKSNFEDMTVEELDNFFADNIGNSKKEG